MQRYQTCKIVNIYHFPPLPQLEKNKACWITVNKSISEKFEFLAEGLNYKLQNTWFFAWCKH